MPMRERGVCVRMTEVTGTKLALFQGFVTLEVSQCPAGIMLGL